MYIYICLLPEGSGPCSSTPSKKHGSGTGLTEIITFAKPPETQRLLECFDFSISKFKKESLHLRNIHMLKRSLATIASKNLCCVAYPVLYKLCEQTWKDWFWTLKQRAKTSRRAGTAQHPYPPHTLQCIEFFCEAQSMDWWFGFKMSQGQLTNFFVGICLSSKNTM